MTKKDLTGVEIFKVDPEKEIAYNRLDHNGYRWYNTWFPKNGTDNNKIISEMEKVSDYMTESALKNGIKDIYKLAEKCNAQNLSYDEYNLFYKGKHTDVWIRMIPRRGDYNLYIHFYEKEMV